MPIDDAFSFDDRYARDLDREPTRHRTPTRRPVLVATGSLRERFKCTALEHEDLKHDDAKWAALKQLGLMPAFNDNDAPMVLALANCGRCHSTLAKEMPATTEEAIALLRREGLL